MQITATDADEPGSPNSQISYKIVKQDPPDIGHMFYIDESTGKIYVKESTLDREVRIHTTVTIQRHYSAQLWLQ